MSSHSNTKLTTNKSKDEEIINGLMEYLLELVSIVVPYPENESPTIEVDSDSDIQILSGSNAQVENITCEVALDLDVARDSRKFCPVCGLEKDLDYQLLTKGKLNFLCSRECVELLRNEKSINCASCARAISSTCQGYLPNFGDWSSVLCSEQCLLKYENDNEPPPKCFQCKKELFSKNIDPIIYYWQTMEFCSTECIEKLQLNWGRHCASCNAIVPKPSLGKYSVRFGNVIKQFCLGFCLEEYKKSLKVCTFCQMDLNKSPSVCVSHIGTADKRRTREFCDTICREQYQMIINSRGMTLNSIKDASNSIPCSQCQRMTDKMNGIEIENKGKRFTLCCSFCLSAFKYSQNVHKVICESCYKFGWSIRTLTILHYSGLTRLFCSKKCLNMFVLKIRRIVPCLTCNVKKYNFDLIERYDSSSSDSKLFCSLHCHNSHNFNAVEPAREMKRSKCDYCQNSLRPQYCLTSSDNAIKNFCSYNCVLSYQQKSTLHSDVTLTSLKPPNDTCISNSIKAQSTYSGKSSQRITPRSPSSTPSTLTIPSSVSITITTSASTLWTPSLRSTRSTTTASLTSTNVSSQVQSSAKSAGSTYISSDRRLAPDRDLTNISSRSQIIIKEVVKESPPLREIIVKAPPPRNMCNKMTMFRSSNKTKALSCKPVTSNHWVQTEESCIHSPDIQFDKKYIPIPIPIPVPIFIPIPPGINFPFPSSLSLLPNSGTVNTNEQEEGPNPPPVMSQGFDDLLTDLDDDLFPGFCLGPNNDQGSRSGEKDEKEKEEEEVPIKKERRKKDKKEKNFENSESHSSSLESGDSVQISNVITVVKRKRAGSETKNYMEYSVIDGIETRRISNRSYSSGAPRVEEVDSCNDESLNSPSLSKRLRGRFKY